MYLKKILVQNFSSHEKKLVEFESNNNLIIITNTGIDNKICEERRIVNHGQA